MFDPTPWMIRGARHSAALGRAELYSSTSGAEGVVEPGDLKVTALATPGGAVEIAPGMALIRSRYAGQTQQTYGARNPATHARTIAENTAATTRYDLVVVRVKDPEYESVPDLTDPHNYQYVYVDVIQGVSSSTTSVSQVASVTYPALALARIAIPGNTAPITNAMITDLRRVALPRKDRDLLTIYPTGDYYNGTPPGTAHMIPTGSYASWPIRSAEKPMIYVPEWANQLQVVVHLSGVHFVPGATNPSVAGIRTVLGGGSNASQNGIMIEDGAGRHHYTVVGEHRINLDKSRGTVMSLDVQAVRTKGSGTWYADYQTSVSIDYEFSETAD